MTPRQTEIIAKATAKKFANTLKRWLMNNPQFRQYVLGRCKDTPQLAKFLAENLAYVLSGAIDSMATDTGIIKKFLAEAGSDLIAEGGQIVSDSELYKALDMYRRLQTLERTSANTLICTRFHQEFPIIVDHDPKLSRDLAKGFGGRLTAINDSLENNPRNIFTRGGRP